MARSMVVSDQFVAAVASAAFPTLAVLVGILINIQRLGDLSRNVDTRFNEVNRRIDDAKDILRAGVFRIEQVFDARLKHLEEHLHH